MRQLAAKAIFFDIDGVIVPEGELYFSDRLSKDFGIPLERIVAFFFNQFERCLIGRLDLKEELTKHMRSWGWAGSVDELLEYWFEAEKHTDKRLMLDIDNLRAGGTSCYIASNQEKYRAEYLLTTVGLARHFDGAFFSCYIGSLKNEKRYYELMFKSVDVRPADSMFWDDNGQNVVIASEFGIDARMYTTYESFRAEMGEEGMLLLH